MQCLHWNDVLSYERLSSNQTFNLHKYFLRLSKLNGAIEDKHPQFSGSKKMLLLQAKSQCIIRQLPTINAFWMEPSNIFIDIDRFIIFSMERRNYKHIWRPENSKCYNEDHENNSYSSVDCKIKQPRYLKIQLYNF